MARRADIGIDQVSESITAGSRLIDVRETDEYVAGHVPGAESWPLSGLAESFERLGNTDSLVIICRSGGRSAQACDFLAERGFDVSNVEGGTMAWAMSGRDLVEGSSPR